MGQLSCALWALHLKNAFAQVSIGQCTTPGCLSVCYVQTQALIVGSKMASLLQQSILSSLETLHKEVFPFVVMWYPVDVSGRSKVTNP
jgi:hypothetical protein